MWIRRVHGMKVTRLTVGGSHGRMKRICNMRLKQGRFEETKLGLVQGGNVSPLCSNIMLNELDHELERRGIRFVRYADDMILFAKTKRSAQRMLENILTYIEDKLRL